MKLGKAKKILGLILAVMVAAGAAGCGKQAAKDGDGARVVRIAHTQAYVPYDFVNEQGESDGFEVAVMQEVAKLLPQYKIPHNIIFVGDLPKTTSGKIQKNELRVLVSTQ